MENKESVVEEVVKEPVVKKAEPRKDINIDLVRKKAFGAIEENYSLYDEEPVAPKSNKVLTTVGVQEDLIEFEEKYGDDIVDEAMMSVSKYNNTQDVSIEMPEEEDINIEDRVEEDLNKSKIHEYDNSIKEVKTSVEEDSKSKIMDDLEKTSTLQILDDIEKELSSIKPISKSYQDEDEEVEEVDNSRTDKVSDDTLEQDLFSLIDSMYEQGEEEEDE